jgi:hypothetical protein
VDDPADFPVWAAARCTISGSDFRLLFVNRSFIERLFFEAVDLLIARNVSNSDVDAPQADDGRRVAHCRADSTFAPSILLFCWICAHVPAMLGYAVQVIRVARALDAEGRTNLAGRLAGFIVLIAWMCISVVMILVIFGMRVCRAEFRITCWCAGLSFFACITTSIGLCQSSINVAFEMGDEELAQLCDGIQGGTMMRQECALDFTRLAGTARGLAWSALGVFAGQLVSAVIALVGRVWLNGKRPRVENRSSSSPSSRDGSFDVSSDSEDDSSFDTGSH